MTEPEPCVHFVTEQCQGCPPDLGAVFEEGNIELAGGVGSSGDLVGPGAVAQQPASAGLKQDLL